MATVNDIMTKTVLFAKAGTPFNEVVNAFTRSKINHLPITNVDGTIRGIISASDVLKAMHEMDKLSQNYNGFSLERRLNVRDEMSKDVLSISQDAELKDAIDILLENNLHAMPVVHEEGLVGIITSNDILRAIKNNDLLK